MGKNITHTNTLNFFQVNDLFNNEEYQYNPGFSINKVERFPEEKIIIWDRNKKYKTIIECLKKGFSYNFTRKLTGAHYITIKLYQERYQNENPNYEFKCGCGRNLGHRGGCDFQFQCNGTLRNMPKVGDKTPIGKRFTKSDVKNMVFWYREQGISAVRIASYFNVEYKRISQVLKSHGVKLKKRTKPGKGITGYGKIPFLVYRTWYAMMNRCYNHSTRGYRYYGGRGIKVCKRWKETAINFYEDMGDRPQNTSIDRIDKNGDYEPSNCRWANQSTQNINRGFINPHRKITDNQAKVILLKYEHQKKKNKKEIARQMNISYNIVFDVLNGNSYLQNKKTLTNKQRERIAVLLKEGIGCRKIANDYKVPPYMIRNIKRVLPTYDQQIHRSA